MNMYLNASVLLRRYLFDHRMGEHEVCTGWGGCHTLRDWFVHNLTVSETGLLNPAIDGFFIGVCATTRDFVSSSPFESSRS